MSNRRLRHVVITSAGTVTSPVLPTLGALTFSSTAFTIGTSASGTITGATIGSTITASGLPTGLTINGAARTWAWDGTGICRFGIVHAH
jgi:hypothetical protein